ncbi:MAG: TetR/AcrR family transcriptional regulator [Solirubrobacteraceae bacterium]|nr:TetR/AcrR family transcriptional regulator [Solirubrobacteraceae bacterium]
MATESRRESPPTARRAAIQAAVLRATEELLAEGVSFADLGIERIATRAGISRTAFYFYFADKRELLLRLTDEVNGLLFEQADRWFSGGGQDPEGELGTALANIAALFREHAVLLRALVEVSAYDGQVASFWRSTIVRFVDAGERRIEEEHAAGRSAVADARATAYALTWMTERALYQQLVESDAPSLEDLVGALTGIWACSIYGG